MKSKTIIAIALASLASMSGVASADGVHLGGAGYYGDVFEQGNPGSRAGTVLAGSSTAGPMGKAAFGTETGTGAMGAGARAGGIHLGGVDYYGDIYEQGNPATRTRSGG